MLRQFPSHSHIAIGDSHRNMGYIMEDIVRLYSRFTGPERLSIGVRMHSRDDGDAVRILDFFMEKFMLSKVVFKRS